MESDVGIGKRESYLRTRSKNVGARIPSLVWCGFIWSEMQGHDLERDKTPKTRNLERPTTWHDEPRFDQSHLTLRHSN